MTLTVTTSLPPLPPKVAYERALRASARRSGVRQSDLEFRPRVRPRRGPSQARRLAFYLAHVAFGVPIRELGRVAGVHHRAVGSAVHCIEDRRDDPDFDASLEELERDLVA